MSRGMCAGIVCATLAAVVTASGEAAAQVPVTVLHAFDALTPPRAPYSPLIQGSDGDFYGTTYERQRDTLRERNENRPVRRYR